MPFPSTNVTTTTSTGATDTEISTANQTLIWAFVLGGTLVLALFYSVSSLMLGKLQYLLIIRRVQVETTSSEGSNEEF
jgi:hypothetical protein